MRGTRTSEYGENMTQVDRVTVLDRRVVAEGTAAEILTHENLLALVPATARGGGRR